MFTPNRSRTSGLSGSRRSTPRVSALKNTPRSSLLQRSIKSRNSLNITSSFLASPTVTSAFSSSNHSIEAYETSIPVLVTEAVALAEDFSDISVNIGENGWSWLVSGLKMFVWSHYHAGASKIPTCKELSLRAVDRGDSYSSNLASVSFSNETGAVSVLAASAFGQLIYWPNILMSTATSYENKLLMAGTHCFKATSIDKHGFLLCTLNGIVHHIFPTHNGVTIKEISKWEGALSKIGRRVSSFFFSTSASDSDIVQMSVNGGRRNGEYTILLLTRQSIQQWTCAFANEREAGTAQLISQGELNEILAPKLSIEIWNCIKPRFTVWALDVKYVTRRGQIALLLAGSESIDMNSPVHYALALAEDLNVLDHVNIFMFQHSDPYSIMTDSSSYPYQLIVEDPSSLTLDHYVMWSSTRALLKSFASTDGDYVEDNVHFAESGDRILGVGNCAGRLILFSAVNGLVTSSSHFQRRLPSILGESTLEASFMSQTGSNRSLPVTPAVSQTKIDQLESSESSAHRLQAAFLHYCKVNLDQAHATVAEAFPHGVANDLLDSAVASLSGDLLDDYPAQDPRWAESVPQDITTEAAGSFILLHQLEDKLKAYSLYLKFLSDVGIKDRLFLVRGARDTVPTQWLLWEHAEKLHASISLLQKHSAHQSLVDAAIRQALNHRDNVSSKEGLTPRDFFYREVTRIDEILEFLLEEEGSAFTKSSHSSRDRVTKVSGVNAILEAILNNVRMYRKSLNMCYSDSEGNYHEYKPWTVGPGRQGIRSIILQQLKITLDRGLPEAEDGQQRALLFQSYSALADLVLEGYQEQITSLSQNDESSVRMAEVQAEYANCRNEVIARLVIVGQRDKAASLAEKFRDFDILIQICDETGDSEKLKKYMMQFSSKGFMEFLFRWYLDRREYRKLLNCCDKPLQNELKSFLKSHPNLAWMEELRSGDYMGAHLTLQNLAGMEKKSVDKKKTFLSLSKLAVAFSGKGRAAVDENIEAINREQLLIKYHERLPSSTEGDLDEMPVYSPVQLIQRYVGEKNESPSESDFIKAFELLTYLPPTYMDDNDPSAADPEEWKMRIWCHLILRDSWSDLDAMLDPADSCSHTVLFKTANLAATSGFLVDILPDVDQLLHRKELSEFCKDASFKYTINAAFEWMKRSLELSQA